jgi:molecular chaperone IbpA
MLLYGGCGHEDLRLFPLYRSTVGFDRLFDLLDQSATAAPNWPPYNIERTSEDDYRITMALAGFSPNEVELVQKENTLFVAGHKTGEQEQNTEILHRGIATRSFRQTFNLAEHVKVVGANFENGLLIIELKREVPEALKPRRIEIAGGAGQANVTNVTTLDQSKVA